MKLKICFYLLSLKILVGCSAFGVLKSNDPQVKISQAYQLIQNGRNFPAIRLFNEVIEIGKKENNLALQAQGYNGLGDVYKVPVAYGVEVQNVTDYAKSSENYRTAAEFYERAGLPKKASLSYFAAGLSAVEIKEMVPIGCQYFNLSEINYAKPTDDKVDVIGYFDSKKTPLPILIKDFKKSYKCK